MTQQRKIKRFTWLLYILWALFANVINAWMIVPLVEDYALLGVLAVVGILIIWLTSVPASARKQWIPFTIFSLLLCQGFSWLTFYPWPRRVIFSFIMFVGLFVITWLFTKIKATTVLISGLVLVAANIVLPVSEWPFLTHFRISHYGSYNIVPGDIAALPFAPISTDHGDAIVTLKLTVPTKSELALLAKNATDSPSALGDILSTYKDEYRLVELSYVNGRIRITDPTPSEIAKINPFDLIGSSFPFSFAHWVRIHNEVVQYMTPALPSQAATGLGMESALYPTNMVVLSEAVRQAQWNIWRQFLSQFSVSPAMPNWQVENGYLVGYYQDRPVRAAVKGTAVVATGSFTGANTSQVLIQGENILQVVDLKSDAVVATYQAGKNEFIPGDIVTGPLSSGGRDAIFVNDSPAYILQASVAGHISKVYTSPNQSLRFEASVQFGSDKSPEIITDDPSAVRDSPIRYFTSYSYRNDNLIRNWRVYRTNVVNVKPVSFASGSQPDLVVGIYGTGEYLLLKRMTWPVLPLAIIGFGMIIVAGWMLRLNGRRRRSVD